MEKFQDFLDSVQYTMNGVKRYEWIFGETFLSTGGPRTTENLLRRIDLPAGAHVLDIGCGVGGHSFIIADKFNATVHAVDLSRNMIRVAQQHLANRPHLAERIKFEILDATNAPEIEDETYDMVYTRDALLHIQDKEKLFENIYRWLKPGGKVVFTDYSIQEKRAPGVQGHSDDFQKYLSERKYVLSDCKEYRRILTSTGFQQVQVEDWTDLFELSLHRELLKLHSRKDEFLEQFSQQDFDQLNDGWNGKLARVARGEQGWLYGYAEKPNK